MTLVATSAWLLFDPRFVRDRPLPPGRRHRAILDLLLSPDTPGRVWLRLAPNNPDSAPFRAADDLEDELEIIGQGLSNALNDPESNRSSWPMPGWTPFDHRIFMDKERAEALFGTTEPGSPGLYLSLDFRFVRTDSGQRWHLSVYVWSHLPQGPEHLPDELAQLPLHPGCDHSIADYRNTFSAMARRVELFLSHGKLGTQHEENKTPARYALQHSHVRLADQRYMQPDFWIVVPTRPAGDLQELLREPMTTDLSRALLGNADLHDDVVATSLVGGEFLVARRLVFEPDGYASTAQQRIPLYLILPATDALHPIQRERALENLVEILSDVENAGGFNLRRVRFDLQIWHNRLRVYRVIAGRGARLASGLATHIPQRGRWRGSRADRIVDKLHQTLLQGLPDLAELVIVTNECRAQVEATTLHLRDMFDDALTQRGWSSGERGTLATALTSTGFVAQLRRDADGAVADAQAVLASYHGLLDAINRAFGERRVREASTLQWVAAFLTPAVGLAAIVTVFDATVNLKPDAGQSPFIEALLTVLHISPATLTEFSVALGFALSALLTGNLLWLLIAGRRGPNLGGVPRHRQQRDLWQMLQDTSTTHLEEFLTLNGEDHARWADLDLRLATTFAQVWDASRSTQLHRGRWRPGDLAVLRDLVDEWSLQSLVFSERAHRIFRYPLPLLTVLYRCVSRLPGSFLRFRYLPAAPANMVSRTELHRVLAETLGFSWDRTMTLDRNLRGQTFSSATQALAEIRRLLEPTPQSDSNSIASADQNQ
jgi:hypothetical protein